MVSDCRILASNIAGDGSWQVDVLSFKTLANYGTCNFGVQQHGGIDFEVGNQNIIDLINGAINPFQWEGRIGASGCMTCNDIWTSDGGIEVYWAIY